ncbi:MAG: radical SAM protein [Deltaproteobacteria bacterium]|nr:radical SAM protein [Deltaproteobacteria bacterium]
MCCTLPRPRRFIRKACRYWRGLPGVSGPAWIRGALDDMADSTYVVKRRLDRTPLWNKAGPRLGQLDVELTERCNNDCLHCCINLPANDAQALAREMTTEQIEGLLRQAADLGCLQVRFTGGEPLLRSDFQELYIFARRLGLKVLLFTNACLVTPGLADLFGRMPPLAQIEITVYGMHRESYEAVTRSPGSFTRFQRGIELLLARHVPFVVKWVILPQNKQEIPEFEAWAATLPGMAGRLPSYVVTLDLRNRRGDKERDALIRSLRLTPQESLAILARDDVKYKQSMKEFASQFLGPSGEKLFTCGAGCSLCIDAYGRIQPCMGVRAPEWTLRAAAAPGGPSPSGGLRDALRRFSSLSDLRAAHREYLRRCARCFLKGVCEQCPAKSWAEHGTLDTPVEYLCEIAHAQARYIGWLDPNEYGWEVMNWRERINRQHSAE